MHSSYLFLYTYNNPYIFHKFRTKYDHSFNLSVFEKLAENKKKTHTTQNVHFFCITLIFY